MTTFKHLFGVVVLCSLLILPIFANQEPEIVEAEFEQISGEKRALLNYPNLRVYVDYEQVTKGEGTAAFNQYIIKHLGPAVQSFFEAALKVKHPLKTPITSNKATLCSLPTPTILKNGGVEADIFVFLNSRNTASKDWVASTTVCTIVTSNGITKPQIVNIALNEKYMTIGDINESPLEHDKNINTLLHEFMHGFGISSSLYKYFIDDSDQRLVNHVSDIKLNGEVRTVLNLAPLTKRLRAFYGCDTIPGVVMENDGSAHFERRFYLGEIMSESAIGSRITEISLGFLEGTGWYIPDYCYAETYTFGQGQGCDFIFGACDANKFEEFCEGEDKACNIFGESGGNCKSDTLSESCRFQKANSVFNCENPQGIYYTTLASKQVYGRGLGSKCFAGNLTSSKTGTSSNNAYCFTYKCLGRGLDTILQVNFGTDSFNCTKKGLTAIEGYYGYVSCPDPYEFCNTVGKPTCRKNCMGNGKCTEGQCQCYPGWEGTDCGFAK